MVEHIRDYITKDLISPSAFFENVESRFGRKYRYERHTPQNLILKGSRLQPLWTLYVDEYKISAICPNPMLMDNDDADKFYDVIYSLIYN